MQESDTTQEITVRSGANLRGPERAGWRYRLARPEVGAVAALIFLAAVLAIAAAVGTEPTEVADPAPAATATDAAAEPETPMTITQVVVISVVQGVTEFLPISSTGHILLVQRAFGISAGRAADAFAICIQAGAILAILGLYFRRSTQIGLGLLGRDPQGLKLGVNIVLAFVPFMFAGLLLYEPIRGLLGLGPSVAMWFVGGLVILAVAWWQRRHDRGPRTGLGIDDITWRMALVIGLIQCLAVVPGTSRALAAILGCLAVGMSMRAAVEFSFLLGVITLLAASVYEGYRNGLEMFDVYGPAILLIALLATALSAAAAVKWMVGYLDRYSIAIFGYYRIGLAIGVAILLLVGFIEG